MFKFILFTILMALPFHSQAALKWQYRSTSCTQSYYATGLRDMTRIQSAIACALTTGPSGTFGTTYLNMTSATNNTNYFVWPAQDNGPVGATAITVLMRIIPVATGNPASIVGVFGLNGIRDNNQGALGGFGISIDTASKPRITMGKSSGAGSEYFNDATCASALTLTQDVPIDVWFVWDGLATANHAAFWSATNGAAATQLCTLTASAALVAPVRGATNSFVTADQTNLRQNLNKFNINELAVWDTAETPSSYGIRTDFITSTAYEGYNFTSLSAANVRSGTTYGPGPGTQTGTAAIPAASHVRAGTAIDATTGTLAVPTASQVLNGISVDATTGNVVLPGVADVRKLTTFGPSSGSTGLAYIPAAASVLLGVNVDQTTGLYTGPATTNVKTGVTYGVSLGSTGSYDGSDRWTCPSSAARLYFGDTLKCNSTSVNMTGTLTPTTNVITQAALNEGVDNRISLTAGDTAVLQLAATTGAGAAFDLTAATFSTTIRGATGNVTFANSQHAIVSAGGGTFTLTLSAADTARLLIGPARDIVTKVTQPGSVTYFRGVRVLTVHRSSPLN